MIDEENNNTIKPVDINTELNDMHKLEPNDVHKLELNDVHKLEPNDVHKLEPNDVYKSKKNIWLFILMLIIMFISLNILYTLNNDKNQIIELINETLDCDCEKINCTQELRTFQYTFINQLIEDSSKCLPIGISNNKSKYNLIPIECLPTEVIEYMASQAE